MKIMIAEDDDDDRLLASTVCREIDETMDIEFVKDGQELMDALQQELDENIKLPDVIILDLNMPKKDGRIALKEIKTNPNLAGVSVVILSTSTSDEDRNYTLSLGAEKYFVKPSDYHSLVDIFRNISSASQ